MNTFLRLVSLPLTALLAFVACNSPDNLPIGSDKQPIACMTNADCPSNTPCVAGVCEQPTISSGGGCTIDTDCAVGELCANGACTLDTSAATGGTGGANSTSGSGNGGCTTTADCPVGELCVNGACTLDTSAATGGAGGANSTSGSGNGG